MSARFSKTASVIGVAVSMALPTPARADMWGGDVPVLTGILVQATDTVVKINEQLQTAIKTYEEVKRYVGYVEEAVEAYKEFSQLNGQMFGQSVRQVIENSFPALGSIRQEAERISSGARWAEGDGALRSAVCVCLRNGSCALVQRALSFEQAKAALESTFGKAPPGASHLEAADNEAAIAVAAGSAQEGRSAVTREYAAELMKQCQERKSKNDQSALAACQAAAAAAEILSLENQANIADGIAEGNRLQALQLELQSWERKREIQEEKERRGMLVEGAKKFMAPQRLQSPGFNLVEGVQ